MRPVSGPLKQSPSLGFGGPSPRKPARRAVPAGPRFAAVWSLRLHHSLSGQVSRSFVLAAGVAASLLFGLPGCTRGKTYDAVGSATPTVAGAAPAQYADVEAAKAAFSRTDGPLTATLEDVAWIRLEPNTHEAPERHPEYFRGLTTMIVRVETEVFVRPTEEVYLLEDSTGVRVTTKPESYTGDVKGGFGPRWLAEFKLVFPHAMSKDVRWLTLTREGPKGGKVRWDFPDGGGACGR